MKKVICFCFCNRKNFNKKVFRQQTSCIHQWKQLSLNTKKQFKNHIQQRYKNEQVSLQNLIIHYEKLISIMIINDQERYALLFYLLFEFELDIYDIPDLKFDALSQGMFNLNSKRLDQIISKKIQIPEQIKLLFLSIMKKHNLQEQQQVLEIKSNWDLQTWLYKQKNTYFLVFQQQGDVELSTFLKKIKLSDIKKYKKRVQLLLKNNQNQESSNLKYINLYLLFKQVIRNYLIIKKTINQIPQQIQSLKKSKSHLELIRTQNITQLESENAPVLTIEDDHVCQGDSNDEYIFYLLRISNNQFQTNTEIVFNKPNTDSFEIIKTLNINK
ncbi:unnamed protein product [Paramecium pentaurelia]|uniref:Uncharacterized protein n=1 Tax=Paramecium pentaurelia TaxID=43138 RepID=A0A8S1XSV9_9CILI|nr:unnamed protein product [Paramecium pentaurelia]